MRYAVDRIEEGIAVCERSDGAVLHARITGLPAGTCEGSVLSFEDGVWTLLPEETARVRHEVFSLQESLFDE